MKNNYKYHNQINKNLVYPDKDGSYPDGLLESLLENAFVSTLKDTKLSLIIPICKL